MDQKYSNDSIPALIVLLYILLLYAISWYSRRLSSRGGMVGYLLAGRGLPTGVIAVMLTGLAVGGASTVGVAQRATSQGISAGWYNTAWAAGAIVMGLLAAAAYRKMEVSTISELFERYYGASGRVLGVLGQILIQVVITSIQYVAGGAILSSLLPITPLQGMLATAVVFVGITLLGGLWAAGLTNIINVILIYTGISLAAVFSFQEALSKVGGAERLGESLQQLPAPNPGFDPWGLGIPLILAGFLVMIPTALGNQSVVQISFAARNPGSARRGFILAGLLILPVGLICPLIGISAAVLHPELQGTPEALSEVVMDLNPYLAGLVLAGLWAADVSTACALLLGSSTLVVGDLIKRFFAPRLEESRELWISRGTVLALSLITFVLAILVAEDILKTLLTGLTLNTGYAMIVLMTLFCPGLCRRGSAVGTLSATFLSLAVWFLLPLEWRKALHHPIYLVLPVSVLSFFLVSLLDRRRIGDTK